MKTKRTSKIFALLLAILMVVAILPFTVLTVFAAAPDQPTNVRWEDSIVKWDAVEDAAEYEIGLIRNNDRVIFNTKTTSTQYDFSDYLMPEGTYSAYVKSINSSNEKSALSSTNDKVIAGTLPTITNVSWDGYVLKWDSVANAQGYTLKLKYENGDDVPNGALSVNATATPSRDIATLIRQVGAGTYYAQIAAWFADPTNSMAKADSPIQTFALPELYDVEYSAGEGTISSSQHTDETNLYGEYTLPSECKYVPPVGKHFSKWDVNGTEYAAGTVITLSENITVTAKYVSCASTLSSDSKTAGCTEAGYKTYYKCNVCNTYYSNEAATDKIPDIESWKKTEGKLNATDHAFSGPTDTDCDNGCGYVRDYAITANGTCGINVTWELTNTGILMIKGTGAITDNSGWSSYKASIVEVQIGEGITEIGESAFENVGTITKVTLPSTLTTIGGWAFQYTSITAINIPESVTDIGKNAFCYTKLTSVVIPGSITEIKGYAFANTALTSVTFNGKVTSININAFKGIGGTSKAVTVLHHGLSAEMQNAFTASVGDETVTVTYTQCVLERVDEKAKTCTTDGHEAYYKCSCSKPLYFTDNTGATIIADVEAWKKGDGKIAAAHDWQTTLSFVDVTGHYYACNKCSEKKDATTHSATDDNDCTTPVDCICGYRITNARIAHEANTDDGNCLTEVTCKHCSTVVTEKKTTHDFTGAWDGKNADGHWHICNNSGCTATDTAVSHNYGSDDTCDNCYYEKAHTHNLTLVPKDDADCTTPGNKAYYTCSGCSDKYWDEAGANKITDESEIVIPASHKYGDLVQQVDAKHTATELKAGKKAHYFCTECSTYFTVEKVATTEADLAIPAPTHTHGTTWETNNTNHWHECSCGHKADENAHIPDREAATETDPIKCTVCQYIMTPKIEHVCANGFKWKGQEATCTTDGWKDYYKCSCDKLYADEACTTMITDLEAWKIGDGKIDKGHTFGEWVSNNNGTHTRICSRNNEHTETLDCSGGEATCINKAVCTACNTAYGEIKTTHTPNADDGDCTTAITCSVCNEITTPANTAHKDEDSNEKCDVCNKNLPTTPGTEPGTEPGTDDPNTPDDPDKKDGLGAGAIVGIVIGSVTVAGVGGFALLWFVIKKKSFADLIRIFKKS